MEEQYDEKYWHLITSLKDSFTQNPNDSHVNFSVFDRLPPDKQALIEELPLEEKKKLAGKIVKPIEDMDFLTDAEEQLLEEIGSGKKQNYKQVICRLTGKTDLNRIRKGYAELMKTYPLLRSVLLYKGLQKPVKVVYESAEKSFPLHDVQKADQKKLIFLMKNVLASEMRRKFHIESDPVLRIQGYLTGPRELLVVISYYPHICFPVGIRNMLYKIFGGMDAENALLPGVSEDAAQQMNQQLVEKSVNYWKKILLSPGKSLTIPGEKSRTEELDREYRKKTTLYKECGGSLAESLKNYCEEAGTSMKTLLLYAWASMLGKLHEENNPMILTTGNGEELKLFPIKADRSVSAKESIQQMDRQMKEASGYRNCTVENIEAATGISFSEFFRMVHHFVNFDELGQMEIGKNSVHTVNGLSEDDLDINLCINYYLYEDKIGMNYIAKKGYIEILLDDLHELFLNELMGILSLGTVKFDKKSLFRVDDTREEKLRKIKKAQIALYLKNSGLFETLTVEEMIMLAGHCRLETYLSGDEILTQESIVSSLSIVGDGKLEESMMAMDGMVKSLRIIGNGKVFGVESLLEKKTAPSSYTVLTSHVQIVEIDKNVLSEVFSKKPEGLLALLQQVNDQKCKLQRLWTMD
ncbi:MAG: condensation domain-containing protein [Lachnospiraceae bacterium]